MRLKHTYKIELSGHMTGLYVCVSINMGLYKAVVLYLFTHLFTAVPYHTEICNVHENLCSYWQLRLTLEVFS